PRCAPSGTRLPCAVPSALRAGLSALERELSCAARAGADEPHTFRRAVLARHRGDGDPGVSHGPVSPGPGAGLLSERGRRADPATPAGAAWAAHRPDGGPMRSGPGH